MSNAPLLDSISRTQVTLRQAEILAWIERFIVEKKYSPTLQEIGTAFGVRRNTVLDHLNALVRKKRITRQRYLSRSIDVVKPGGLPAADVVAELLHVVLCEVSPDERAAAIANARAFLGEKEGP